MNGPFGHRCVVLFVQCAWQAASLPQLSKQGVLL